MTNIHPLPKVSAALPYTGEIRQEWTFIKDTKHTPADRLAALLRRIDNVPSYEQGQLATSLLKQHPTCDPRLVFKCEPELAALHHAIAERWTFIDKYTERWSLIYAVWCHPPFLVGGAADVASTELSQEAVVEKFRGTKACHYKTRISRLLKSVATTGTICYFLPLECFRGDLDKADEVKQFWRIAAKRQGVSFAHTPFPQMRSWWGEEEKHHRDHKELAQWTTEGRTWPGHDAFYDVGTRFTPIL